MHPNQSPGTETFESVIDELNSLIALDLDAVAAYEAAIERLENPTYTQHLSEFMMDHERHVRELTSCVTMLGGEPRRKADFRKILTKGKVILANIAGDKQILHAMKSNEDQTNEKYEKAVNECGVKAPPQVREVLTRGLQDERRHRSWIEQAIREM
jgi:uncharacterized protein (TIGR02284 family)